MARARDIRRRAGKDASTRDLVEELKRVVPDTLTSPTFLRRTATSVKAFRRKAHRTLTGQR